MGRVPFPPTLFSQEWGERGQHHQPHWSRGPGWPRCLSRRGTVGQDSELPHAPNPQLPHRLWEDSLLCWARGMGSDLPPTFLLCDQAHQDPNGVLVGVLSPVSRVDPWQREEKDLPRSRLQAWVSAPVALGLSSEKPLPPSLVSVAAPCTQLCSHLRAI